MRLKTSRGGMPRYPARAPQREPFSTELKGQNRQTIHKTVYVFRPGRASTACYRQWRRPRVPEGRFSSNYMYSYILSPNMAVIDCCSLSAVRRRLVYPGGADTPVPVGPVGATEPRSNSPQNVSDPEDISTVCRSLSLHFISLENNCTSNHSWSSFVTAQLIHLPPCFETLGTLRQNLRSAQTVRSRTPRRHFILLAVSLGLGLGVPLNFVHSHEAQHEAPRSRGL